MVTMVIMVAMVMVIMVIMVVMLVKTLRLKFGRDFEAEAFVNIGQGTSKSTFGANKQVIKRALSLMLKPSTHGP